MNMVWPELAVLVSTPMVLVCVYACSKATKLTSTYFTLCEFSSTDLTITISKAGKPGWLC